MSTPNLSQDLLAAAEEQFEKDDFEGAVELMETLTMQLPNSSKNHMMFSRYLVAYSIHMTFSQGGSCYDILKISDPACGQEMIKRKYKEIVAALNPKGNTSVAAKNAFIIVRSAGNVLSDRNKRKAYDIEKGFVKTTKRRRRRYFLRDEEP